MKTVSGKVVSTQQISLSKAAKLISRFTASDNEATPAFAAYLRRTSAAFNELDQLHKEYKIVVGKIKTKKDHSSTGVVTDGTGNSVKTVGYSGVKEIKSDMANKVGLNIEKDSRKARDKVKVLSDVGTSKMETEVKSNERKVDGHVPDVGGVKEIKRDMANEVGLNVEKVSRKARDKVKVLSDVGTSKMESEVKSNERKVDGNVPDVGGVLKKSKKKKGMDDKNVSEVNEERVSCSIRSAEQNFESKVKNKVDVKDEKKHKKKRSHEAEVKDNERNVETEVPDKKANRKRKHERVADGELAGSQEAVISKKKKILAYLPII